MSIWCGMLAGNASTSTSVRISASMPSIVLLGLWKAIGTIARTGISKFGAKKSI